MKTSYLAFGTSVLGIGLVIVACGGADSSNSDVLGSPTSLQNTTSSSTSSGTSGTSGVTSSSSSGSGSSSTSSSSSSGDVDACAACAIQPPQGCHFTNPGSCDCSITCPDAGPQKIPCTWSKNDTCPTGMYCNALNCGQGTCTDKLANETSANDPQCGCDGITYFNTSVAGKNGMAIRSNGACGENIQVTCGALACPTGVTCNRQQKNKANCGSLTPAANCWQMPAACNTTLPKEARACTALQCADACSAIKSGAAWYEDGSCN